MMGLWSAVERCCVMRPLDPRSALPDPPGFTIAELTLVLTICGLLMAIALPRLAWARDRWAVRAAMADVAGSFALARQTALARRTPVAIVFDTVRGALRLRSAGAPLRDANLAASYGVGLGASRDSAVYDPRGLGYGLSNLTVTVRRGIFVDTLTMSRLGRTRW